MINKRLLWIASGLTVIAGILVLLQPSFLMPPDEHIGRPLVETETIVNVSKVVLSGGEQTLSMERNTAAGHDGTWLFTGKQVMVDGEKLALFFDQLTKNRVIDVRKVTDSTREELGFDRPTKVQLFTGANEVATILFGKQTGTGGQFAGFPEPKEKSYLMNGSYMTEVDENSWEYRRLLTIDPAKIKQLAFYDESNHLVARLERPAQDKDPELVAARKGEVPAVGNIRSAFAFLSQFNFNQRVDPNNQEALGALSKPARVEATLFNGCQYQILVGDIGEKESRKYFARIFVTEPPNAAATLDEATKQQNALLKKLMVYWLVELDGRQAEQFRSPRTFFATAVATK